MALLQDIIAAATVTDGDVPSLLRRALVLATRLKNEDLRTWVSHELNGYPDEDAVPAYRKLQVISYGFFADRFVGQATLQIPLSVLPQELREGYQYVVLQNPISALVDLLHRGTKEGSPLTFPWPTAARQFAKKVSPLECIRAWREVDLSYVSGVVDTVKTRILSLSLELEQADPAAGSGSVSLATCNGTSGNWT